MTKQVFISALLSRGFTHSEYNTNNAWGFGGGIGDRYVRGDTVVKIGTAYSRHLAPSRYMTVTVAGRRVLNAIPSSRVFDQALKKLKITLDV